MDYRISPIGPESRFTGSGFIVLAATLASVGTIPVASIALILGVDRFMSEARALTNLIGNGLATVVVAKWEGALDETRMHAHLVRETAEQFVLDLIAGKLFR